MPSSEPISHNVSVLASTSSPLANEQLISAPNSASQKKRSSSDHSTIVEDELVKSHDDEEKNIGVPAQGVGANEDIEGKEDIEKRGSEQAAAAEASEEVEELKSHHANGLKDQSALLPVKQILVVFAAMQLAVFLSFLEQTIVSTALPNISAYFDSGRSSSWVPSIYLLFSTAFQPIWGRLSDIFGRKRTLELCLSIFAIGSLACALAQSMIQLIIFRGLQGVGGGGLLTLVLIIVSDVVSLRERGKYQGITEITIVFANGFGPVIGGALSQKAKWQYCFWLCLPIAVIAIVFIHIFLPLKAVKGDMKTKIRQIDAGGAVLTIATCCLVLLPLNWGGVSYAWSSPTVLGCFAGSAVCFVLFMLYEWKIPKIPIIPMFIFKIRTCAAVFFNTTISGATILAQVYYIPQLLQITRGDSAIRSGTLILPLLLTTTVSVFICGQVVARVGEYKVFIVCGYAVWAVALGLLSTLSENSSTARLVGFLILCGAGQGQTLQSSLVAVQAAVQRSEMAVATSTRNFLRSFGGTLSLAIASTIINNTLKSNLRPQGFTDALINNVIDSPTEIWHVTTAEGRQLFDLPTAQKAEIIRAYVKGFKILFLVLAGLQALNCIIAFIGIQRLSLVRNDEKALKEKGRLMLEEKAAKRRAKKGGSKDVEKGHIESKTVTSTLTGEQPKA